ncbi:DUF4360 domain-containing protein [Leucothrix arctica]|nr:DUF4360 domain-containing protein [Leucothrix arctica]
MKKFTNTVLAASALVLFASQAQAAPNVSGVKINSTAYAGNGCSSGSASVVISPDKTSVSFLFDEYIAEAGGQGQRTFDRKKCDIALGLKIPRGISVSLVNADYRGFHDLPRGATSTFTRDYFFAGKTGPTMKKTWRGARSDDFKVTDNLAVLANVWSKCGTDVILRSKSAATVKTKRGHEALMMVDSIDLKSKTLFRYNFRYRTC